MSKYIILISASVSSICGGFVYLKTNRSTTTPTSPPDEYIDLPEIFSQYNNNNFGEADKVDDSVDFSKTMENWFPKWEFLIKVKNELDCLKLAQTNDYNQSLRAARTIDKIDLKQFRRPLLLDKIIIKINGQIQHFESLHELMVHLLRCTLETNYQSECANYLTRQTLVLFEHNNPLTDFSFYHEYSTTNHRQKSDDLNYIQMKRYKNLYFQTLLQNIMSNENLATCLINNGLLIALLKFLQLFTDRDSIRWISTIISALSVYKSIHTHFYHTGWIGILAEWLRSSDWHLKLEAGKTLYNMSMTMKTNESLHPSTYLLWPLHEIDTLRLEYDVVFIHGLKELWPRSWLAQDFHNCRIIAVHYDSFLSSWNINCSSDEFTIKDRSVQLIKELREAGIGSKPIIWVTHSMGGLFVKHMLTYCHSDISDNHPFLRQTKGIVFYSVPHRGSEMAVWSQNIQRIIYPSNHVLELQKDSPQLLQLNDEFIRLVRDRQIDLLSFGETKKCTLLKNPIEWRALLVPEESANPGIGKFILLPENHFSICKPKDRNDRSYRELKEFIAEILLKEKLESTKKSSWRKYASFS
ncbi:protein SERAC1 isoform X2 [Dermatophagoides farinae]|uniref:protein SERAC1 isoform X2 n=1 Tax=Dermatophagoides farinae TaxID=6954 RepID=UPI001F0DD28C|nr:protein SERAC1-like isoform X2 [Dermatophagoides farinae]